MGNSIHGKAERTTSGKLLLTYARFLCNPLLFKYSWFKLNVRTSLSFIYYSVRWFLQFISQVIIVPFVIIAVISKHMKSRQAGEIGYNYIEYFRTFFDNENIVLVINLTTTKVITNKKGYTNKSDLTMGIKKKKMKKKKHS